MRFTLITWLLTLLVSVSVQAELKEFSLLATLQNSAEPLTTEKVWSIAPEELNPHRVRWAVGREVGLSGLMPVADAQGRFKVVIDAIRANTTTYIRPLGPWFQNLGAFSCEKNPDTWFSTEQGAAVAAKAAADEWREVLDHGRLKLSFLLSKVSELDAEKAVAEAQRAFKIWLQSSENEWFKSGKNRARLAEWSYYHAESKKLGACASPRAAVEIPAWSSMVEPPFETPRTQLLARLPARRWGGLYTVRMSAGFGDKTLNGRFVVDSGSASSVVSPDWLRGQGINPALVELPGVPVQKLIWSGGHGMARRAVPFQVNLGGYVVPLTEFGVMKTELFEPPNFLATCCDGVIGTDILRHFAVEFVPGPPSEIILWERKGYSLGVSAPWIEVASSPSGEPVSTSCWLSVDSGRKKISGARWDTGSEELLEVHEPWHQVLGSPTGGARLECSGVELGVQLPWSRSREHPGMSSRVPGFSVGMGILNRGPFTLDLSHGRIWFSKAAIKAPLFANRSGLQVDYRFDRREEGERRLEVKSIAPGSTASRLVAEGLHPGVLIDAIDSKPVDELDSWEVDQHLAGVYGPKTILQWRVGKTIKTAELKTR